MFTLLIAVALAVAVVVFVVRGIVVVHEGEAAVVLRLGRFDRVQRPGPCFIAPFVEDYVLVPTTPLVVRVAGAGFTRDGVRVGVDVTLVTKVVEPKFALRHHASLTAQAGDATTATIATAIALLDAVELTTGDRLAALAHEPLGVALIGIGLGVESLRIGPVALPHALASALADDVVAQRRRDGELVAADTARLVHAIRVTARTHELRELNRVARTLDGRTLALVRLDALVAAAANGGQVNIVTGLDDDVEVRPAIALPPPRRRDAA